MPQNSPYQYQATDSPLTLANQYGIQPQQLISANPGGYPFTNGQVINIPRFNSPGAPNPYAPAIAAQPSPTTYQPQNAPRQYQPYVQATQGTPNYTTANSFTSGVPGLTAGQPNNAAMGYSQLAAQNPWLPPSMGANSFTSGSGVNLQTGMDNSRFLYDLAERLRANPAELANLPQSARDAIEATMQQGQQGQQQQSNQPQTNNNWMTNSRLRTVNYKGKFETTAKWAENAYRRERRRDERGGGDTQSKRTAPRFTGFGVINLNIGSG